MAILCGVGWRWARAKHREFNDGSSVAQCVVRCSTFTTMKCHGVSVMAKRQCMMHRLTFAGVVLPALWRGGVSVNVAGAFS